MPNILNASKVRQGSKSALNDWIESLLDQSYISLVTSYLMFRTMEGAKQGRQR